MDNALYVGLSQQMVLRREMEIIANNIANLDTTGFKVESLMQKTDARAPAMTLGGPKPVKFVTADGVARDFGQGALRRTDGELDFAIEGQGFFRLQGPDGERFTRDGRFRTDEIGRLVAQNGSPVMDEGGGEIVIDPEKGQVSVSADGVVSQGAERIGKIGMFTFETLAALEKTGDNQYRNTANLLPQPAAEARLRQGMLEGSNVQAILEITRMVEVSRAYERTNRMIDSEADLSRRSVERLGKVQ
ncbi:flagellar basal-body rod protein FlgF [Phenylobacterium zucineum HLK1]|uniref:Flagellar basal-body rod protein FlgF n=1 Tax=Phenylobacterium zucineum (strain HLK1) TaxID=450851 RepID=B4RGW4_PHEZH|nr:flagellar basal-body rod protein FlgF [Phenylobacterium zucineum]ACG77330.1 flagellar basal-body rod protein FlgF [Phenylobacterium zucineum HLK1]